MNIELRSIQLNEKEILSNLWEKYDYEFSQYDNSDVNELGLYGGKDLDWYWKRGEKWGYFVIVDGNLAGFVMISNAPEVDGVEADWQIGEFFIMYKYRRKGVGRQAFFLVLDKHKGKCQLRRHPKNTGTVYFWDSVINEYTKGKYELIKSSPKAVYSDGTRGDVFVFYSDNRTN